MNAPSDAARHAMNAPFDAARHAMNAPFDAARHAMNAPPDAARHAMNAPFDAARHAMNAPFDAARHAMNAPPDAARRGRVLALGLAAGLVLVGNDPCGPLPGSELSGEVVTEPVGDWSFAADVSRCQLEVRPGDPHSVTTYCLPDHEVLYVAAIMGADKQWTKMALAEPTARLRIAGRIYPVTLERLVAPEERLAAAVAGYRSRHDGADPPDDFEVDDHRWYFRVVSRGAHAGG